MFLTFLKNKNVFFFFQIFLIFFSQLSKSAKGRVPSRIEIENRALINRNENKTGRLLVPGLNMHCFLGSEKIHDL